MSYRLLRRLAGASAVLFVIVQAARASPIQYVPGAGAAPPAILPWNLTSSVPAESENTALPDAGCTAEPSPLGTDDCDSAAWIEPLELMVDDSPSGLEAEDAMLATFVAALAAVTVAESASNEYSMTQQPERILAEIANFPSLGANFLPPAARTTFTPNNTGTLVADASEPVDPDRSGWVDVDVPVEYLLWVALPALIVAAVVAIAALTGPSNRRSHRQRRTRV